MQKPEPNRRKTRFSTIMENLSLLVRFRLPTAEGLLLRKIVGAVTVLI